MMLGKSKGAGRFQPEIAMHDRRYSDDDPNDPLTAMLAVPVGHPSRPALRDQAIRAWLPMAERLARRYANRGVPTDDLVQTATVGLIKAVDRFVDGHGAGFVGYAIPTILGELKRHFRDQAWMIRVPRRLQELRLAITAANAELTQTLSRSPTVADIATHLGLTEESILEGLEGAQAYRTVSLSAPMYSDGTRVLSDTLGEDDDALAHAEARIALAPAMRSLDEREREILTLRFYGNLTQSDIAQQMGISQMHVSRLISRGLSTLRRRLDSE
jgi:RNA polymerase sigma-B factor